MHTYVAGLRRVLDPGRSRRGPSQVLASAPGGYVLRLDADRVDAIVFERGLAAGRRLRGSGDLNGAIASLDAALGEWHGSAFAGVPGPFATAERVRLAELRSAAAEERADVLLELGRHEQAVPELASLVAEHPLRERMRGLLMVALYRCGRQAEALQAFHDARQVLADELGIDPGPELSRIHQQILALDPRLEAPGRGAPAGPVTATALPLPPPAAGPAVTDPVPAQLPLEAPGFSGRHTELERMLRVIGADPALDPALGVPDGPPVNDTVQIIAITGTAGVGKTALANRFARQVAKRFPDGQLYVNLRGFDPSGSAMSPESALRFFLDALAVPPQRMPVGRRGTGRAVPQHAGRQAGAGRAGQRARPGPGPPAAARLAGVAGRGDQPVPAHRAGRGRGRHPADPGRADRGGGPRVAGPPAGPGRGRGRARRGGRADLALRPAAAGAGGGRGPGRHPARVLAGRPGRRAAGHQEPAGGAGRRRRRH